MKAITAVLALVGVFALAAVFAIEVGSDSVVREPTSMLAGQGYPPPVTDTPAPTATPTPDANGYLPPPSFLATQEVSLTMSPYNTLLASIQTALDNSDSQSIASYVDDLNVGVRLFNINDIDGHGGGGTLDQAGAATLLDVFFTAGSTPRIQGYFDTPGYAGSRCLNVLLHRFEVPVPHPTEIAIAEFPHAPPFPESIDYNAASWTICDDGAGVWTWQEWVYGGYYDKILSKYATMPDFATPYYVLR